MKISLSRVVGGDREAHLVECPQALLNMFPRPQTLGLHPFSILATDEQIPNGDDIILTAEKLQALLVGRPGYAVLVAKRRSSASVLRAHEMPSEFGGAGDAEFLRIVDADLLDQGLKDAARLMLRRVRELQPEGDLRAGGGRRFVNYPDNFVGFTVQPRKQAILVHVRESTTSKSSDLEQSPDRRPYVRLWVKAYADSASGSAAIEGSWRRGR